MLQIRLYLALIICVSLLSAVVGCRHIQRETNTATEFMAWSFARGVVAARLPQPRKALFPQFRPEYVERAGDGVFVVRATVGSADEYGNPVSYRFSVIANYRGNDIFEATEIELLRE